MVGAYASLTLMTSLGLNYWVAMLGAGVVVAILSVLSERLVFHPLRDAPPIHDKIAAIGILLFLEAGIQALYGRSEEHTSELQSRENLVCRLLLEKTNML